MASTTETIIFDLKIDIGKALQQQSDLKKSIEDIRAAQKANSDKTSAEYINNEAQLKNLNHQLLNNSKILQANAQNANDETGAYRKLSDAYLFQAAKAKDLAVAYGFSDQRTKDATASADKMANQLKEVDKAVGQNQRSVGDYAKATEGLSGAFSQMPGALGKVSGAVGTATSGFQAMNAASPVGWIQIAIQVFAGLIQKFSSFAPVADSIGNSLAKLSAAFDVLKNGVIAVITGQKSLGEVISGASAEMNKQVKEAERLAEAQRDLEDRTEASTVSQEKYKNQINELLLQSKNRTLSEKQRIALIDEALKIEDKAFKERKAIADDEIKMIQDRLIKQGGLNAFEASELRKRGVNYARYKENQKNLDDETIKELAAAQVKQAQIEGESISMREKALNRKEALEQKAQEARDKRTEAQKVKDAKESERKRKEADEEAAFEIKTRETLAKMKADSEIAQDKLSDELRTTRMSRKQAQQTIEIKAENELKVQQAATQFEAESIAEKQTYDAKIAAAEKVGADTTAITKLHEIAKTKIKERETVAQLELSSGFARDIATVFGKSTTIGKTAASAQIAIDTYKGAFAAYTSLASIPVVGIPLGIAAAAAVGVTGAKAIKDVWSVPVPGGGGGGGGQAPNVAMGGGSNIPQASVAGGLVARSTPPNQISQTAQGVDAALKANPMQPVLVTNDLTVAQDQKVLLKTNNSL